MTQLNFNNKHLLSTGLFKLCTIKLPTKYTQLSYKAVIGMDFSFGSDDFHCLLQVNVTLQHEICYYNCG